MAQLNYNQIEEALRYNMPFNHGTSMTAVLDNGEYNVFSYSTKIYSENTKTGENWMNNQKYSSTTSRQQNLIRRIKGV